MEGDTANGHRQTTRHGVPVIIAGSPVVQLLWGSTVQYKHTECV